MSSSFFSFKVRSSFLVALAVALFALTVAGCDDQVTNSADQVTQQRQEAITKRLTDQVSLPNIVNYTEYKRAKKIYELRDQARVVTYSYTQDMNGHMHKLCDSIGYPLPYATQISASEKNVWMDGGGTHTWINTNLPQSEPNGLFMPASADGTWVECVNPNNTSQTGVMYVEPHVVTSAWPLTAAN